MEDYALASFAPLWTVSEGVNGRLFQLRSGFYQHGNPFLRNHAPEKSGGESGNSELPPYFIFGYGRFQCGAAGFCDKHSVARNAALNEHVPDGVRHSDEMGEETRIPFHLGMLPRDDNVTREDSAWLLGDFCGERRNNEIRAEVGVNNVELLRPKEPEVSRELADLKLSLERDVDLLPGYPLI